MSIRLVFLFLLVFGQLAVSAVAGESRTWRDQSGKFSQEAVLVDQTPDAVRLRKTDGKIIRVPRTKLCEEDQRYLEEFQENPFLAGEESESDSPDPTGTILSPQPAKGAATVEIPELKGPVQIGDRTGEKQILTGGKAKSWDYVPVEIPKSAVPLVSNAIPVYSDHRFDDTPIFCNEKLLVGDGDHPQAVFGVRQGDLLQGTDWLEIADLEAGTSRLVSVPFQTTLYDLGPDGRLLAIHEYKPANGGFNIKDVLCILNTAGESIQVEQEFAPYRNADKASFWQATQGNVDGAFWVDTKRIATGQKQKTTFWNLDGCQAEFTLDSLLKTFSLSPDRTVFACGHDGQVELRQITDGALLGTVDTGEDRIEITAFSPDGQRLAAATQTTLVIISLKDGQIQSKIPCSGFLADTSLFWPDSTCLLAGDMLYDLERGIPWCQYQPLSSSQDKMACAFGQFWLVVQKGFGTDRVLGLNHVTLPHPEAITVRDKMNPDEYFALRPGGKIAISLELNDLANEQDIRKELVQNIEKHGFSADDAAPVQLVIRFRDTGEEVEVSYNQGDARFTPPVPVPFGPRPRELGHMKLKVFVQEAELVEKDEILWTFKKLTTGPQNVEYDPDKKIEDVLRESNKPEPEFVTFLPLPRYLARSGAHALTSATITLSGVHPD